MTACEAQAAGRAVVSFDVGGLADTLVHESTGYLAQARDVADFANGLIRAIGDSRSSNRWGEAARTFALDRWQPASVVRRYLSLYEKILDAA